MRVAINGAGIAGGCLAYWLEHSGHDVVLIEKAPQFRTGGYVVDCWGVGYTVAERMGILPEVRAHGYTFREVQDVDKRGRQSVYEVNVKAKNVYDHLATGSLNTRPNRVAREPGAYR
jgi:2-polyprenyl-6-methoxyphenol hydroxylase-like FAD-dependent oxidoreductase